MAPEILNLDGWSQAPQQFAVTDFIGTRSALKRGTGSEFNVHGSLHRNTILVYNSNQMHKPQILSYLTTAPHVSGVTITHLQEHKTTVTTASGNQMLQLQLFCSPEDG